LIGHDREPPIFRFSIRELVLLTVIVAMSVGWAIDRMGLVAKVNEIHSAAVRLENQVGPRMGFLIPEP
jgi:hypothetical protein